MGSWVLTRLLELTSQGRWRKSSRVLKDSPGQPPTPTPQKGRASHLWVPGLRKVKVICVLVSSGA